MIDEMAAVEKFDLVDAPQVSPAGRFGRCGNPFYAELQAAMTAAPEGKAVRVPVPEGVPIATYAKRMRMMFHLNVERKRWVAGHVLHVVMASDSNSVIMWRTRKEQP